MILGLDISTNITGATILSGEKVIYNEAWELKNKKKFPTLYSKAAFVKERLIEINKEYTLSKIAIEKPFMFFNSGGSSAKTMSILQNFNGMISWLCYELFGLTPIHITAQQARKTVGLKIPRGENSKQKCLDFVLEQVPAFVVNYTRYGNVQAETFDRSDSYIVAKAGGLIED